MNNYVATFYTHYGALKFDKACKSLNINSKPMPVPRKLSSSCGTCVMFDAASHEFLLDLEFNEDLESCYLVTGREEYKRVHTDQ